MLSWASFRDPTLSLCNQPLCVQGVGVPGSEDRWAPSWRLLCVHFNSPTEFEGWRPILKVASVLGNREQNGKHTYTNGVSILVALRNVDPKKKKHTHRTKTPRWDRELGGLVSGRPVELSPSSSCWLFLCRGWNFPLPEQWPLDNLFSCLPRYDRLCLIFQSDCP